MLASRDLGSSDLWLRSLERSRRRRVIAVEGRKQSARRKGGSVAMSAALAAGPGSSIPAATAAAHPASSKKASSSPRLKRAMARVLLEYGSSGEAVAAVQRSLGIPADGIFGPQTQGAVRSFQDENELRTSGRVDERTWETLLFVERLETAGPLSSRESAEQRRSAKAPDDGTLVLGIDTTDKERPRVSARVEAAPRNEMVALNEAAPETRTSEPKTRTPEPEARTSEPEKPPAEKKSEPPREDTSRTEAKDDAEDAEKKRAERREKAEDDASERREARDERPARREGSSRGEGTLIESSCSTGRLARPVAGKLTSGFGPRWGRLHGGIDIAAPTGTPIKAAACGVVSQAGVAGGYGNMVCVRHTSTFTTCYAHMSRIGAKLGAFVRIGEVIGYVGSTGNSTGPHLHFETRVGGSPRQPMAYLRGQQMLPGKPVKISASTGRALRVSTSRTRSQPAPRSSSLRVNRWRKASRSYAAAGRKATSTPKRSGWTAHASRPSTYSPGADEQSSSAPQADTSTQESTQTQQTPVEQSSPSVSAPSSTGSGSSDGTASTTPEPSTAGPVETPDTSASPSNADGSSSTGGSASSGGSTSSDTSASTGESADATEPPASSGSSASTGSSGSTESTDAPESSSSTGSSGGSGSTGSSDSTGAAGSSESSGSSGASGSTESPGSTGSAGATESSGSTGSSGATESSGSSAATGSTGSTDSSGSSGATDSTGPSPAPSESLGSAGSSDGSSASSGGTGSTAGSGSTSSTTEDSAGASSSAEGSATTP